MNNGERVATWLDLAAMPHWWPNPRRLRLHAVGGRRNGCFAVSVDGRWLHTSDGELTVFHGLETAVRFLKAARIEAFEPGEAPPEPVRCDGRHFGLGVGRNGCMMTCRECGRVPEFNG